MRPRTRPLNFQPHDDVHVSICRDFEIAQQERDEAAVLLAKIDAAIVGLDDQLQNIARQHESLRESQRNLRSGVISAHELKSRADFDLALRHAETELLSERNALEIRLQQARDQLIDAQQEVARLDKLQQLQQSRHQAKMRQREQREYDATMTARHTI